MRRRIFIILLSGLFIFGVNNLSSAMMCGKHSRHQEMAPAHSEHEHSTIESVSVDTSTEAVEVGNKICPVFGERINEETKATYEYEGKIYNFCCEMCIEEFKKDPEKYIEKIEKEKSEENKEEHPIHKYHHSH